MFSAKTAASISDVFPTLKLTVSNFSRTLHCPPKRKALPTRTHNLNMC